MNWFAVNADKNRVIAMNAAPMRKRAIKLEKTIDHATVPKKLSKDNGNAHCIDGQGGKILAEDNAAEGNRCSQESLVGFLCTFF